MTMTAYLSSRRLLDIHLQSPSCSPHPGPSALPHRPHTLPPSPPDLQRLYRAPLDRLEESTTGMADLVLVNR